MAKCGGYNSAAEWAKNDPEGLIKAMNKNGRAAALINKASPQVLKGFMGAVGRDLMSPFGWLGGEIIFSTMFSAEAEKRGKTPLEALDTGLLWFLPKGVIDAQKKALFGYEGTPSGMYKMEGYAGAYSQDRISDMENYLDMEDADRKYWEAKDKRKNFETMRYDSEVIKKRVLDKIDATIKKHGAASTDAVRKIYETNTGLRTDGTPRYEDMYMEDLQALVKQTGDNLWDVQQQYAIDEINRSKEGDLNTLYAKREGTVPGFADIFAKGARKLGIPFPEEGQLPFGMGPAGNIATAITDPYDMYRASSPLKAGERLPSGIKEGYQKILDLWNMGLISQEEKEQYAIEQGREDLLYKEYNHPLYGPGYSYEQIKRVYPDYFEEYAGGGIAGLLKKK